MTSYFEAGKKTCSKLFGNYISNFLGCRWCIYDMYDPRILHGSVCVCLKNTDVLRWIRCLWGMIFRKPHTGTWKDELTSGYANKSFQKWLKHIVFLGDSVVKVKVRDPKLSQFRVLYHQDLLFCVSQFSGLPLFEPPWSKSFELQRSDGCGLGSK